MMIQEPGSLHSTMIPGYELVGFSLGKSCILVPNDLTPSILWVSNLQFSEHEWASSVALGSLGVCSCYFPHCGRPTDFVAAMHECRVQLTILRSMGCKQIILGCDLNSQLPANCDDLTGPACLFEVPQHHLQRVQMMLSLMSEFGLYAANTFTQKAEFTRK